MQLNELLENMKLLCDNNPEVLLSIDNVLCDIDGLTYNFITNKVEIKSSKRRRSKENSKKSVRPYSSLFEDNTENK